jgi:hypothetical protein
MELFLLFWPCLQGIFDVSLLQKKGVVKKSFTFRVKKIFSGGVSREEDEGGEGRKRGGAPSRNHELPLIEWTEKGKLVNQIPAYEKTNEAV